MTDKIKVYIRLRPVDVESAQDGDCYENMFKWSDHRLCPTQGKEATRGKDGYLFQKIFSPDASNKDVFHEIKDVVSSGLDGISGTVLAYGQTATGKTHTMQGSKTDVGTSARLVDSLFEEASKRSDWHFTMTVGFFEIYNEHVYDLLTSDVSELELRCDTLVGLQGVDCSTAEEAKASLKNGEANRKKSKTDLNERSSRSHTIFRIQIVGTCNGRKRSSHLNLVDLAGSECAKAAGTTDETTLREGSAINKSLLSLTHVIKQLADKSSHVNYRDSKLTRILSNSLGGSARTYLICCITARQKFFSETMSTIHFADRARVVYNSVKINETDGKLLVSYSDHFRLMSMYEEDLNIAEQRELAMEDVIQQEVKTALATAAADSAAETRLFEELDFVSQEKIAGLDKQKTESEKEVRRLEKEVHKLQQIINDNEKAIERTKGNKSESEEKLRDIRKQLKEKEAIIKDKNKLLSTQASGSENIEKTQQQLEDLTGKYTQLEEEKNTLSVQVSQRDEKISDLEDDIGSLKKNSESITEQNSIKRAKIASLCGKTSSVANLINNIKEVQSDFLKNHSKQSKKSLKHPPLSDVSREILSLANRRPLLPSKIVDEFNWNGSKKTLIAPSPSRVLTPARSSTPVCLFFF